MSARALLAALLLASGSAEALDVPVAAYHETARAGKTGTVTGLVAAEPRTLSAPRVPFTGAGVTLLPRSDALLARLEQVKARSRDSPSNFTGAAPEMRQAREAYERALRDAGGADLVRVTTVEPDGAFRLDEVPAGAWLVFVWHGVPVKVSSPRMRARDRGQYRARPRLLGLEEVTIWLRPLAVEAGGIATLDLNDRNAWFRGVVEKRGPGPGR